AAASSPGRPGSSRLHRFFPAGLEKFAQLRARAVEPRAHGADRQLERLGHALVGEVLPREEQERLAFAGGQRLDRGRYAREEQAGGRVAVVDQPEGLGLAQRAADHLRVRERTHHYLFPDGGVRFAGQRNEQIKLAAGVPRSTLSTWPSSPSTRSKPRLIED